MSTRAEGNRNAPGTMTEEFVQEWRDAAYTCFSSTSNFGWWPKRMMPAFG